jgi:hypothetical protein
MSDVKENDPVPAVTEETATGATAEIFADIRHTLDVDVVNLIWRHLATIPGALAWVWDSLKPLYLSSARRPAAQVRKTLALPSVPPLSKDALVLVGVDAQALASIRTVLDGYQHTNALALVCFSAFLARFGTRQNSFKVTPRTLDADDLHVPPGRAVLPRLISIPEMHPPLASLIYELNGFGEDSDPALVASMYRHLAHWPPYLALIRTLLAPLHETGELRSLVATTRRLGDELGADLSREISPTARAFDVEPILRAIDRFLRHPIARMTSVCALIARSTPR